MRNFLAENITCISAGIVRFPVFIYEYKRLGKGNVMGQKDITEKMLADYFVQTRMNEDYIPSQETITHVDEMLKLMSVLTDDSRFEEAQNSLPKGGVVKMCDVLDKAEARGAIKVYYLELKYSAEQIAEKLHLTTEEVENVISSLEEE